MKLSHFPLPNAALPWLLLAQVFNLVLHYSYLPISLWGLVIVFIGWRWLMRSGHLPYPNRNLKGLVVLITVAVLVMNIRGFSLESAGTFLIATSLLKLIELRTLRDGYIAIFLNFFVLAVGFLFTQEMLSALWGIVIVNVLLVALASMHLMPNAQHSNKQLFALSAKLMLWSLPMMLVLYLLFPRFGPLWSFTLQSDQARTGLSDNMAAADIAELSQSSELAFRASFTDNQIPERRHLYWRALVLDHYDGRRWTTTYQSKVEWYSPQQQSEVGLEYEIIQEPTAKNWLFALSNPQALEPRTGVTDDQRLVARRPVHQRLRYRALFQSTVQTAQELSPYQRGLYLQLPQQGNQQARAWAQELSVLAPEVAANTIMQRFSEGEFYYTLKPQRYGTDEIDEFLFQRQQGFCAHYAGAMVFLARAAGIPARVVTGYQGGEWNAKEHYLTVRQFDAHAWVELWFADGGWQSFDPTAMVAEERILFGLAQAVADEGTFLQGQFSAYHFHGVAWVNQLRLWADNMEYVWQKWVLSYDNERQSSFLQNVLKLKDYQQGLYIIAASFVVFFMLASLLLWWRLRPQPQAPLLKAWGKLQQQGRRLHIEPDVGESLEHYLQRIAQQQPIVAEQAQRLASQINSVLYQEVVVSAESEQGLIQALREFTKELKRRR